VPVADASVAEADAEFQTETLPSIHCDGPRTAAILRCRGCTPGGDLLKYDAVPHVGARPAARPPADFGRESTRLGLIDNKLYSLLVEFLLCEFWWKRAKFLPSFFFE
jgi:hypothetical protein